MGLLRRAAPEARLDPVRFRRPGRTAVLRSGTVAVLLAVAGVLAWAGPSPCRAPDDARAGTAATAPRTGGPGSGPAFARERDPATGPGSGPGPSSGLDPGTGSGSGPAGGQAIDPDPWSAADPAPGAASRRPSGPAVAPGTGGGPAVPAGRVGVALRLADPAALALVAPGNRVDVLRVGGSGRTARVAGAALVLGVTDADDFLTAGLLVALTPAEAHRAVADPGRGFAVLLHPQ